MSSNEISYLILGHITQDLTPSGVELGGTAAYSGLTACALGHSVRLVTAYPQEGKLPSAKKLVIQRCSTENATQFENLMRNGRRSQYCYSQAEILLPDCIPTEWLSSDIVHFGPVAQEIPLETIQVFANHSFLCATPQGWMRSWDEDGLVHPIMWVWAEEVLPLMQAVVISLDDVGGDEKVIDELVRLCKILVVTEAEDGARVYWKGDARYFPAPNIPIVDTTGAGDIFAAVYFSRLFITGDAWQSARIAVQLASLSVSRIGLQSIPTVQDIQHNMVEIIK
ncbi:MAG: PfkB family carbohydrate kinase [Anaerolineaceae bacterium]